MKYKIIRRTLLICIGILLLSFKVTYADQKYNYKYGYDWWLSNYDDWYPAYNGKVNWWGQTPTTADVFPKTFAESLQSGRKISNHVGQWITAPRGYYISEKGWTNNLGSTRYSQMFSGSGISYGNSNNYSHPKSSAHGTNYSVSYDAHYRGGNDSGPWMDSVLNTYKGYYYHVYRQPKPDKGYAKPIGAQYVSGNTYWYKEGNEIGIETSYHDYEGFPASSLSRRRWARLYLQGSGTRVLSMGVDDNGNDFVDQRNSSYLSSSRQETTTYNTSSNIIDRWYAKTNNEADYIIGSLAWNGLSFSVDDTENDRESYSLRVDGTPPTISGGSSVNWTNKYVTISPSATDSRSGMSSIELYDSSNNEVDSGKNSLSYTVYEEGVSNYTIKAYDNVGNMSQKAVQVKIDETEPEVKFNPNERTWVNTNITVGITVSDSLSGVKSWRYQTSSNGGSTWSSWVSGSGTSKNITFTTDGRYEIKVEVTDNAGNVNTVTSGTYELDKTPPTITGTDKSGLYDWTKDEVQVEQEASDSGSGMEKIILTDEKGTKLEENWDSIWMYVSDEGIHKYTVKAYDVAGNIATKSITVKIDETAPKGNVTYNYDNQTMDLSIQVDSVVETGSGVDKIWVEYFPVDEENNIVYETLVNTSGDYKGGKNLYDIFPESTSPIRMVIKAMDKVGNERRLSDNEFDVFRIEATINRVWAPYQSIFKEGELGVVKVRVYGGVEEVEIEFPEELTNLDYNLDTYMYLSPKKSDSVDYEFFVPIGAEHKIYNVKVTGYKRGEEKVVYPTMEVIGNILTEVRTRIR